MSKQDRLIEAILCIITVLLSAGIIGFLIYIHVKYGNMPYSEVPAWVNWLMGN